MKKILKILFIVFICIIILLILIIQYLEKNGIKYIDYKCSGNIIEYNDNYITDIYLKLARYKYKIRGSFGDLTLEIPNELNVYYNKLDLVGHNLHIYRHDNFAGSFSTLSNSISIKLDMIGTFQGQCEQINY